MALSHAIATALLDGPLSGYDLARRFETSLGFFWAASHQQIYQELKKLTQAGHLAARHIEQSGRPDKVEYELTDDGHQALADWALTESRRRPAKDDLFVKLYQLNEQNRAHLIQEIRERLRQHQEKSALYEKIRARHYADPQTLSQRRQGVYLALSAGIRYEAMFIDWCREALALLDPDAQTAH